MSSTIPGLANPRAPVLLLHWGGPDELDEISNIQETLDEYYLEHISPVEMDGEHVRVSAYYRFLYRKLRGLAGSAIDDWVAAERRFASREEGVPFMECIKCESPDSQDFLDTLAHALREWRNRQLLYISCHGNSYALSYAELEGPSVQYDDVNTVLDCEIRDEDSISLVYGSCEALGMYTPSANGLPDGIVRVYGFTERPTAPNVACLVAGVIADDQRLFSKLSAASLTRLGWGVTGTAAIDEAMVDVYERWNRIMDENVENPTYFVVGHRGGMVRALRRIDYEGQRIWQGFAVELRPGIGARVPAGWLR